MVNPIFTDRKQAGMLLAEKLLKYKGTHTLVLGIPRGGVPLASEVSKKLGAELDVAMAKKIGHPMNPEYAVGSVSPETVIINTQEEIPENYIKQKVKEIRSTLIKKSALFRGNKPPLKIKNRNVIIVDDGIATGSTLLATIETLRKAQASRIIVASPVVPADRIPAISSVADDFIYLHAAYDFPGVGAFYESFDQVSDEEVIRLLRTS